MTPTLLIMGKRNYDPLVETTNTKECNILQSTLDPTKISRRWIWFFGVVGPNSTLFIFIHLVGQDELLLGLLRLAQHDQLGLVAIGVYLCIALQAFCHLLTFVALCKIVCSRLSTVFRQPLYL